MDRAKHVQELMEGFYVLQQKMLARHNPIASISQITFSQWRVLEILDRVRQATIKEIHIALGITSSAATQLVNELVKKEYASRTADPHDGRISAVILSPKMKRFLEKMRKEHLNATLDLFKSLSDKEFTQYINLNKKIIKNI